MKFDLLYRRDEAEHRKLQARARKARAADTDSLPIVITGELNRRMSDEIETLPRVLHRDSNGSCGGDPGMKEISSRSRSGAPQGVEAIYRCP